MLLKKLKNPRYWLLFVLLLFAFFIRVYGSKFGLPGRLRPDEQFLIEIAINFGKNGNYNPHEFVYGSVFRFLLYFIYWIYSILLYFRTGISSSEFWNSYSVTHTSFFYYLARLVTAIFGTATVGVIWKIAKDNHSERHAWLSAILLSVVFLHVRESHFATTDILTTFFTVCAFLFAARIMKYGRWVDYLCAGILSGLAIGTKYNSGIILISILFAHFWYTHTLPNPERKNLQSKYLLGYMFLAGIVFFIFNPYILLDYSNFFTELGVMSTHLKTGHHGIQMSWGWIYHFMFTLPYGMGWFLFILSLVGVIVGFIRREPMDWLYISFVLSYYFYIGNGYLVFVRYLTPLIPFMVLLAIDAIEYVYLKVECWGKTYSILIYFFLVFTSMLPTLLVSIRFDYLMSQKDTRNLAAEWIYTHIPKESVIATSGIHGRPTIPYKSKYHLYSVGIYKSDVTWLTEALINKMQRDIHLEYIIVDYHPLHYSVPLRTHGDYEPQNCVAIFSPLKNPQETIPLSDFDPLDAFYTPYRHLWHYSRPGPIIKIYKLSDVSITTTISN